MGICDLSRNTAISGAGIYAVSSTIAIHNPGVLNLHNNTAVYGSGVYLEANSKLYILKSSAGGGTLLKFVGNHANYGAGIYIDDVSNPGACIVDTECFFQSLALHQTSLSSESTKHIQFADNDASEYGSDIFGGLLDRCTPSPFSEVYLKERVQYSGFNYLEELTNIELQQLHSVSSHPVRICYCSDEGELDCDYKPPTITVRKGEAFTVSLAAVDHANNTVDANIISSLSSLDGGFGEGQQTQIVLKKAGCSLVKYNVFSPYESETINLYADGPCGSAKFSTTNLSITFTDCTCPIGFEPVSNSPNTTRCECDCDLKLHPHITQCNSNTSSILRMNTNSWITYTNDTDPPGYVIHSTCPFDYCLPPTQTVSINLNHLNETDNQCAYNHRGVLCGACQENYSLSLGSSLCVPCHIYWPAVFVAILIAAIIAGVLLVIVMLTLNMTVALGLVNGFIFYVNIVAAGSSVFFPSSEPSFPTIFVAWLNLDIGVDVCFVSGLDVYSKTWLQLVFPLYIIILVALVIVGSDYSQGFASLIGKKDPVATLATLILLSYAKLLSTTITALSFTVLRYPDGSLDYVWLADGNIKYFSGKHIPLALAALLVVLIGLPYTILLSLWQWIVRAPRWRVLAWSRNSKLNAFIDTYHAPYNRKYRFWTGLLLVVRVILYITASVTVSSTPQTLPLITAILVGAIFLLKGAIGVRVYKSTLVDTVDTTMYFNLLAFAILSQYNFKTDLTKQTAVAYLSTIITCILLIWSIAYHMFLLLRKEKSSEDLADQYPAGEPTKDHITRTVIEFPKSDTSQPTESNDRRDEDEMSVTTITNIGTNASSTQ